MVNDRILNLTDDSFDEEVNRRRGTMLVDFWTTWCAPCKTIAPFLDALADELGDRASIAKVDVGQNGDLANRFGIMSVPTLVVFRDGKIVDQMIGAAPEDEIRRLVTKHLD